MHIAGFAQERGACTTLRIKHPLERIAELKLADVDIIAIGNAETEGIIRKSDAVLIGRAASDHVLNIVKHMQSFGKKVVFDLDDNMFDISIFSPHYKQLGSMNVDFENPDGTKGEMWEHGKGGFDVKANRQIRRAFIQLVRQANAVTVTTPPLAKVYKRFNDHVHVVPNAINFRTWEMPNIAWQGPEVRLLYTGAANHFEDWLFIAPVLKELQEKYKHLTIVLLGTDWNRGQNNLDYSRIEVHRWVDFEAYPYLCKSLCCHIGIAPISKTDFNDCRSELKWIEYSALKMATVASPWGPYKRSIRDRITGLLADEREEWVQALSSLIENVDFRNQLASNAYKECSRKYNLDYAVDQWMSVFQEVQGRN